MQPNQFVPYRNVMEPLVAEEVQRQLQQLPPKLVKYLGSVAKTIQERTMDLT